MDMEWECEEERERAFGECVIKCYCDAVFAIFFFIHFFCCSPETAPNETKRLAILSYPKYTVRCKSMRECRSSYLPKAFHRTIDFNFVISLILYVLRFFFSSSYIFSLIFFRLVHIHTDTHTFHFLSRRRNIQNYTLLLFICWYSSAS